MLVINRFTNKPIGEFDISHGADLHGANLSSADLSDANLRSADLSGANLSGANLSDADLIGADLSGSDLSGADLRGANLIGADLSSADLRGANLRGANLSSADLSDANLRSADLSGANLSGANLSGAQGISNQIDFFSSIESNDNGYILYKTFDSSFPHPNYWTIENGSQISEVCNPDRGTECGCGINVATAKWVLENTQGEAWRCLIRWSWLPGVIVPFDTDGKIRCERAELLGTISREELQTKVGEK